MSRVGKKPIEIPESVEVKLEGTTLKVKGPQGELSQEIHPTVSIEVKEKEIIVSVKNQEDKEEKALWGTFRNLINNMVLGVTEGFKKQLEVNGVGYKVALQGKNLNLHLGFSHAIDFPIPEGIEVEVDNNVITIKGIDKQLVGETAAQIRKLRKPEPYKGKGIKYIDEVVRRKEGKALKGAEGGGA